jgi:hypothetical protein
MIANNEEGAKAFNLGSDARLAGFPRTSNPFGKTDKLEWYWESGWSHVHKYWGRDARWLVRRLVRVLE